MPPHAVRQAALPPWRKPTYWLQEPRYAFRFNAGLRQLRKHGLSIAALAQTDPGAPQKELWRRLTANRPSARAELRALEVSLDGDLGRRVQDYWRRFEPHYANVGTAREKALEHALTFELLSFDEVRRYCDVAAASSPIQHAIERDFSHVEMWRQDLIYRTNLELRRIGGLAQHMTDIEDGFFDALTLHCSYEHFAGKADVEFLAEVDRVLSSKGACLILPLYIAAEHRIYFDPSLVTPESLQSYDRESALCALWHYRQEHGRYYSPESLWTRVLGKLPSGLAATLLCFTNQASIHPSIYVRFGLVLHRRSSILKLP